MCWVMPMLKFGACCCKRACTTTTPSTRCTAPGCGRGCGCWMWAAGRAMCRSWPPGWSGPAGTVLGVDAAAEIIEVARTSGRRAGSVVGQFRAGHGRRHRPGRTGRRRGRAADPDASARPGVRAAPTSRLVRPGGVIAFCETDIGAVRSVPETPQFRAVTEGIAERLSGCWPRPRVRHDAAQPVSARGLALTTTEPCGADRRSQQPRYLCLRDGGLALGASHRGATGLGHQ